MIRPKLAWLIALCLLACVPRLGSAGTLYANGPLWPGNYGGYTISGGYLISNSFTLSSPSVVDSVVFLSRNPPGSPVTAVNWSVSSGDVYNGYGTILGQGTASVSSSLMFSLPEGRDVFTNTFSVDGGLGLDAGTYFLTLGHAQVVGGTTSWVVNNGPSTAWHSSLGSLEGWCGTPDMATGCSGSESFQIMGPLDHTINDIVRNAVTVKAVGNEIDAEFTPNFGLTLDQAAAIGHFDHFNWVQTIEQYPGHFLVPNDGSCNMTFPLLFLPSYDPPSGGMNCQPADSLPFYWDEWDASQASDPWFLLSSQESSNKLSFSDAPSDNLIPWYGQYMQFDTALVGVYPDGSWYPLYTFDWKSDFDGGGGGVSGAPRTKTPYDGPAGAGGVYDVYALDTATNVPGDVLQLWLDNGATLSPEPVPEPASLLLLGTGVLGLAGRAWRRRRG